MIELVDVENKSSSSVLYSLELLHNTLLRPQKAAEQTRVLLVHAAVAFLDLKYG